MNASEVSRNSSTSAASRNSSTSSASRNSSASSASPIKTLYVINHLRDVERMLTWIPPVMMALKLTISHMEMTLYSTVSFPYFFKPATNLMTSNLSPALAFGKLFNIKVLPALNTDIYFGFHFRLFLYPFSARALYCQSFLRTKIRNDRKKQKYSSSNLFKPWSHHLPHLSLTWLVAL